MVLEIDDLSVFYEKTPVLLHLSLRVKGGELVAIVGPNGAGKSTLLRAILGVIKSESGKVRLFGKPLGKVRNRIAYVPQCESVDWDFPITVFDLVLMGCYGRSRFRLWASREEKKVAWKALEKVGMAPFAKRQISQLSCGQRQRVFLARALVQEADLYFLDEPFAGIDAASSKAVLNTLQELRDSGKTLLVVHHDLDSVSRDFDSVILLNRQLIAYGPTPSTFTQPLIDETYATA
ncbi:MAG: metal ABC transporter ATP-binding protein [Chlamydiales bacterium]|nr:metal ABC transporter ATP-binding protein [Chlamydiales bacterium]